MDNIKVRERVNDYVPLTVVNNKTYLFTYLVFRSEYDDSESYQDY